MSRGEFFRLLSRLISYLSSGHSHVPYLWNRPDNPLNSVLHHDSYGFWWIGWSVGDRWWTEGLLGWRCCSLGQHCVSRWRARQRWKWKSGRRRKWVRIYTQRLYFGIIIIWQYPSCRLVLSMHISINTNHGVFSLWASLCVSSLCSSVVWWGEREMSGLSLKDTYVSEGYNCVFARVTWIRAYITVTVTGALI